MIDRLTDDELHRIVESPYPCFDSVHIRLAVELLELRAARRPPLGPAEEALRFIDRALWVDHGDGNLDGLTGELPIWADEWGWRIVDAVNDQSAQRPPLDSPTPAEIAELREAVLYSYEAGQPNLESISSAWVREVASQPDGGLVDVIDTPARLAEAAQRPPLESVCGNCGAAWRSRPILADEEVQT